MSVNINNGTVKTFIKEIEKQTRYTFVYRNNVLNDQAKVTVNCKNKPLDQVLSQVFTPLNVSYSLNNNTIVLVKQEVQQQKKNEKKTIKGTVTDGKGEPIIGANVIQEGGIGTIQINIARLISLTTLRNPAVSLVLTCVSVIIRSALPIW